MSCPSRKRDAGRADHRRESDIAYLLSIETMSIRTTWSRQLPPWATTSKTSRTSVAAVEWFASVSSRLYPHDAPIGRELSHFRPRARVGKLGDVPLGRELSQCGTVCSEVDPGQGSRDVTRSSRAGTCLWNGVPANSSRWAVLVSSLRATPVISLWPSGGGAGVRVRWAGRYGPAGSCRRG